MDISVATGLYPVHVSSTSILNHEDQPRIRGGLLGPCQHGNQVPCSVALALEVSGLGTTRPSTRPSQSLPFSSSSQYPISSRQALVIPDTDQDPLNQRSWPQPIPLSVGQEAFPRKEGGGAGGRWAQTRIRQVPVAFLFGSHCRGLIVDSPEARILIHIRMRYSAFRT